MREELLFDYGIWNLQHVESCHTHTRSLFTQGSCFTRGVCAKKFTRPHQEEKAYDGEMVDVCVDGAFRGVVEIKVGVQGFDEGD